MENNKMKKGIIQPLISRVLWASYSVKMYSLLNPFHGDSSDLSSWKGLSMVVLGAVGIAWLDAVLAGIVEMIYCKQQGLFEEFKKQLKSDNFFKIMPAAIFAGPLGLVPFAIASRYSVSVETSISAFYPALGSILATLGLKRRCHLRSLWVFCLRYRKLL